MLGTDSSSSGGNQHNPFGFGGGDSNPFNPFMPHNEKSDSKMGGSSGGFNVDDLVKRIDAKIAELEEEERQEKEKLENANKVVEPFSTINEFKPVSDEPMVSNVPKFEDDASKNTSSQSKNTGITDDQFFDDFFFDE